jgi:hypothetical protein
MITTNMQEFLTNNVFPTSGTEPTNVFQRNVGTNIKSIRVITSKEDRWKYCKLNPTAPSIKGFTAPVVTSRNASAFRLAKFLSDTPHQQMSLSLSLLTLTTQITKYRIFKKFQLMVN